MDTLTTKKRQPKRIRGWGFYYKPAISSKYTGAYRTLTVPYDPIRNRSNRSIDNNSIRNISINSGGRGSGGRSIDGRSSDGRGSDGRGSGVRSSGGRGRCGNGSSSSSSSSSSGSIGGSSDISDSMTGIVNRDENLLTNSESLLTMFIGGVCDWPYDLSNVSRILELIADDRNTKFVLNGFNNQYYNQIGYEKYGIRFVVDIDSKVEFDKKDIINIVQCVTHVLYLYYGQNVDVFVSRCGPRPKIHEGRKYMKDGLHLIGHVQVSIDESIQMLHSISVYMKSKYPALFGKVELDDNIYRKHNGSVTARMLYSSKHIDCKECILDNDIRLDSCIYCYKGKIRGMPKVPIMYSYHGQVPRDFTRDFNRTHVTPLMTLKHHSVWCLDIENESKFNFSIPRGYSNVTNQNINTSDSFKLGKRKRPLSKRTVSKKSKRIVDLPQNILNALLRHICSRFPRLYSMDNIRMTSTKLWGSGQINIYLDSKMCFHLHRQHNSSTIWLCIRRNNPNTMFLRCCSNKMHKKSVSNTFKIESDIFRAVWELV